MANPIAQAFAAIREPFFVGPGGRRMSQDEIARERELASALMQQGNPAFNNAGWLGAIGRGLEGAYSGWSEGRANRAADENATFNRETVAGLLGGLGGGSTASTSPVAAALTGNTPADPASARVAAAHSASAAPGQFSGSQQEFVDMLLPAAMEASQRTGIDPRIIVAQAAQETGWGRSAPGNNFFGIKSHGQGGGQTLKTHEYVNGKRVNVSDSFRTFADPSDSVRGYADFILNNPRYKPFMQADGLDAQLEALQASGYATDPNYSRSVGSIARGIALPEQPSQAALESLAVGESMPMLASTPAQDPVQVAQAGGVNPAIIEALSSPYADEGTRRIAGLLLGQHMEQQQQANDPMRQLDMDYKRAQIGKLRADASGPAELGLNPQYGVDANGNPVLIQIGKDGKAVQTALPEGVTLSKEPIRMDAGTHFVLLDPITRQPVGQIPKENREAARETAIGKIEGESLGEAQINLGGTLQKADQSIALIDQMLSHPGFEAATGLSSVLDPRNYIAGTDATNFNVMRKQLEGKAFLEAFESLKGGGQITEVEGKKATEAIARLSTAQSEEAYRNALGELRGILELGKQRAVQRAGQQPVSGSDWQDIGGVRIRRKQ